MKRQRMLDLLADHAAALNRVENEGEMDAAAWLVDYEPITNRATLLVLLQLAQAVKRALVPVAPSPLSRTKIKSHLMQSQESIETSQLISRGVWVGAAIAGSVLSLVGLVAFILSRTRLLANRSDTVASAV